VQDPRQGLAGTLALLALTVVALFALALAEGEPGDGTVPEERAAEATLDPEELLELGAASTPRVAHGVEEIRRLPFQRVPEPQVSDTDRLIRLTERELARADVARDLAIADAELRLLGLLEPGQSLEQVATDVSAGALAYYDPRSEELFLLGDAVPAGPELAEFILAHELTHALEDERFGLPRSHGLSDDRTLAEAALVEGTATALMIRYARRNLDPIALAAELAGLDSGATAELPRFAEAEVEFTYLEGAEFADELIRLAGDWTLVDYAYEKRLPATTEQVLHPEKYLDDERPLPVAPPASPGPGWRAIDTGSLGEFGTREVLSAAEPGLGAELGAAGWGGDSYRAFARTGADLGCADACRRTHALGVRWRGDSAAQARELQRELRGYVVAALGGEPAGAGTYDLDGGAAAIAIAGDEVGLGLAPGVATARRLARP
jgi:hypothetical protein